MFCRGTRFKHQYSMKRLDFAQNYEIIYDFEFLFPNYNLKTKQYLSSAYNFHKYRVFCCIFNHQIIKNILCLLEKAGYLKKKLF